jgi:tol-pal system protein YbgF
MQTIHTRTILCAVLVSAAAAVPASAQNREHLQMAAELRMMQQQNEQLSLALAQLTEALKAVNIRLDANEQFQQRRFADQERLVNNIGSDLSVIRERTQDTDTRLRSLRDEIDALRQTFLALPGLLAQAQAQAAAAAAAAAATPPDPNDPAATTSQTAPAPSPGAPPAPAPPIPAPIELRLPETAGLSPNRLFDTASSDYAAGQYTAAIAGFEQVVKNFPTAKHAEDAQYFIGESLLHMNRHAEAIAAYNRLITTYPTSDQANMAFYRRGFVESLMGQPELARATWEELLKRYPDSDGAQFAKQRLAGLNRSAPVTPPAR